MKNEFYYLYTLVTIVFLAILFLVIQIAFVTYPYKRPPVKVFCPMEERKCSDGSFVTRVWPGCEFAQCPLDKTTEWYACSKDTDCVGVYKIDEVCVTSCPDNAVNRNYITEYSKERARQVQIKKDSAPLAACPLYLPPTVESCIKSSPAKCVAGACKIVEQK